MEISKTDFQSILDTMPDKFTLKDLIEKVEQFFLKSGRGLSEEWYTLKEKWLSGPYAYN
jgi:hypothetical protein